MKVLAGAYVSEDHKFKIGAKPFSFTGLPHADIEVDQIEATFPNTKRLQDKEFSVDAFTLKMNEYKVIHLATHAAVVPGDPRDSFILFGSGEHPSLRDIGDWTLNNVDLVVLSACETALGSASNGEEILGLGYQFQKLGVRATIASLWQVSDGSTQVLMNEFYSHLKNKKLSSLEAMQQAQIALIKGNATPSEDASRASIRVVSDSKSEQTSYDHPYYWAPFILIGNGM